MNRLLLAAALTVVLSACSTLFPQSACTQSAPATPAASAPTGQESLTQKQEDLMWDLSTKSVYFESGSYAIKPEYQDFLTKVYKFLQATPDMSIGLIGNADERGRTQNVDGQKRADAVKQLFKSLGLPESRIQAISLGDKNPRATCHEEKCWAQNRRVDLVFLGSTSAGKQSLTSAAH
jgi:peptidoglycan-associated lipoprotein